MDEVQKIDDRTFTVATSTPVAYNVDQLLAQKADLLGRIAFIDSLLEAAAKQGVAVDAPAEEVAQ